MTRTLIIASHHRLAAGMADTLDYITNTSLPVQVLTAYMDNVPVDNQITHLMKSIKADSEVFIFTDIMAGSVNQGFIPYLNRPHTHLITGMNLPVLMSIALCPDKQYLTKEKVKTLVDEAKEALKYVDLADMSLDADDEQMMNNLKASRKLWEAFFRISYWEAGNENFKGN